jgi:hypothetical protein
VAAVVGSLLLLLVVGPLVGETGVTPVLAGLVAWAAGVVGSAVGAWVVITIKVGVGGGVVGSPSCGVGCGVQAAAARITSMKRVKTFGLLWDFIHPLLLIIIRSYFNLPFP